MHDWAHYGISSLALRRIAHARGVATVGITPLPTDDLQAGERRECEHIDADRVGEAEDNDGAGRHLSVEAKSTVVTRLI